MTGPIVLASLFALYGVTYIAFAFREPPAALARLFRVPSVFVFLPDAHRMRIGRLAVGMLYILTPAWVAYRVMRDAT